MPRSPLSLVPLLLAAALALIPHAASAAADDLDAEYAAAKADLSAKSYPAALDRCARALATADLAPETRWKFWLVAAIAHERQSQPAAALSYYHRFLNGLAAYPTPLTKEWSDRERGIGDVLRRLQRQQLEVDGALSLASSPPGARVFVDGNAAGPDGHEQTPATLYLAPGQHTVRLELAGYRSSEFPVLVLRGRTGELSAALAPAEPTIVVAPTPPGPVPPKEPAALPPPAPETSPGLEVTVAPAALLGGSARPSGKSPLWGWVLLGGGAAVALAGIPCTVLAGQDHDELVKLEGADPNDPANKKRHADLSSSMTGKQVAAGVLYGVGGAALAAGATWLIVAALRDEPAAGPSLGVLPTLGGATLTLGGRW